MDRNTRHPKYDLALELLLLLSPKPVEMDDLPEDLGLGDPTSIRGIRTRLRDFHGFKTYIIRSKSGQRIRLDDKDWRVAQDVCQGYWRRLYGGKRQLGCGMNPNPTTSPPPPDRRRADTTALPLVLGGQGRSPANTQAAAGTVVACIGLTVLTVILAGCV